MKSVGLALVCFIACAAPAWAEVVEIPMPELQGAYPLSETMAERTTTVHLPALPSVISGAWVRLSGSVVVGEVSCEFNSGPWPMDFVVYLPSGEIGWIAGPPPMMTSGDFSVTTAFHRLAPGVDWSFLMDGEARITLWGAPAYLAGPCSEISTPSGVIDEAVLIVDAEYPLPVATSTWGRIKALYR